MLRNSLGDADGEGDLSLESLFDTGGGQRGAFGISWSASSGGIMYSQDTRVAYGTKSAVAVAPVCLTASETFLKTGRSRCVWPAFLGFVPPTTLVPRRAAQCEHSNLTVMRSDFPRLYRTVLNGLLGVETAHLHN